MKYWGGSLSFRLRTSNVFNGRSTWSMGLMERPPRQSDSNLMTRIIVRFFRNSGEENESGRAAERESSFLLGGVYFRQSQRTYIRVL